jgi:hypothetical protein
MLHRQVLFVGDRPSPKTAHSLKAPFVGMTSYKTVLSYIYKLDLDLNLVEAINAFDFQGQPQVLPENIRKYRVVALGESPASVLNKVPGLIFFTLPDPTVPFKDKKLLSERIAKCRRWIYGESK